MIYSQVTPDNKDQSDAVLDDKVDAQDSSAAALTTGLISGLLLTACGGGGSDNGAASPAKLEASPSSASGSITSEQASRFLAQASMGATREQIDSVQSLGYEGWLDEQFELPASASRWEWLAANGFNAPNYRNSEAGFDAIAWRKLLASPDTLRQRITLALSEILVVGIDGLKGGWRAFSAAAYLDLLEANAFGNYRPLLEEISTSTAMGDFLTFRGNVKYNPGTGALPDENYARELMQLFTIGLVQLNLDGIPKLENGMPQESYSQDDVAGLARVFTGWNYDLAGGNNSTPDFHQRPMTQVASRHEQGEKTFLGTTIPEGADGATSLRLALDSIFAHPNVAPFISRQLIQRLVCSNPSPAYVARVATVFNDDGTGTKGNLKAVLKALLLDDEARNDPDPRNVSFGKLREPILRFAAWARAFNVTSPSDAWRIGDTSDPASRLGQSPLRSPSVFNFFRPGYVPPNSGIGSAALVAPEFQITNESTVVGYVNFLQRAVSQGIGDVKADYSELLPLADDAQSLLDELNLVLAAGQLSAATLTLMKRGLDTMPGGTDAARRNRVLAALLLVLAAPEFIVQK